MLAAHIDILTRNHLPLQVNVGEPECGIAFGGRGRRSLMPAEMDALAGDHDFHVVSLTPSVTLMVDFEGVDAGVDVTTASFYQGQAHVCLKDSIFQASTTERHAVELGQLLQKYPASPVLFAHTDGGPDHNCKHLSVQMSWLGLFLRGGHDMLVVSRVAPTQSWTNPAERVMGPLNLALQNMALARTPMGDDFEAAMKRCNGMSAVRAVASEEDVEREVADAPDSSSPAQPESATPAPALPEHAEGTDLETPGPQPDPRDADPMAPDSSTHAADTSSQSDLALLAEAAGQPLDDEMAPDNPSAQDLDSTAVLISDGDATSEDDEDDEGESGSESDSNSWKLLIGEGSGDDDDEVELVDEEDDEVELVDTEECGGALPPTTALPAARLVVPGFKQTYRESISVVMSAVEKQITRSTWADKNIKVHPPATDEEVMSCTPLQSFLQTPLPFFPFPNFTDHVLSLSNRWVASLPC